MTKTINNEKQIPSQMFMGLIGFVQKQYAFDSEAFLKQRSLDKDYLLKDGNMVRVSYVNELIEELLAIHQDYRILFEISKLSTPSSLGVLGYLMVHSKNAHDALMMLCKYYMLIGKRIQPVFCAVDNAYKIVIYFNDKQGDMMDFEGYNAQIHLFAIIHLINHIINKKVDVSYICFIQKAAFKLQNNQIDGMRVLFDQDENAIYFDKNIIKHRTLCANEQLLKIFEKEAEETLQLKLNQSALKEKIAGLILLSSSSLDISLYSIAKRAGYHPRVLQLKLKEEGTTFSQILLEVRKKLCSYYLSRDMDLSAISLSLGYIDLSSFFRAFKKWHNMTPKEWKKKNVSTLGSNKK